MEATSVVWARYKLDVVIIGAAVVGVSRGVVPFLILGSHIFKFSSKIFGNLANYEPKFQVVMKAR